MSVLLYKDASHLEKQLFQLRHLPKKTSQDFKPGNFIFYPELVQQPPANLFWTSSDRQVVRSGSAAGSAAPAQPALVLLPEPPVRAQQQLVAHSVLDLEHAGLPAGGGVAARVLAPQEALLLELVAGGLLPPVRVAAHLQQRGLLHGGGDLVLLGGHVVRVLLAGQAVVGEREWQEV